MNLLSFLRMHLHERKQDDSPADRGHDYTEIRRGLRSKALLHRAIFLSITYRFVEVVG